MFSSKILDVMKCAIIILLLAMVPYSIKATTYYVAVPDEGGSDNNPGTISRPWATWQKGFNTAVAGDTVYFRGGVWYHQKNEAGFKFDPKINNGHNGTQSNPVVFMGYPPDLAAGDTAIYDCRYYVPLGPPFVKSYNVGVNIKYANHVHFKNFAIRNVYQYREYVEATGLALNDCENITCENLYIYNISGIGIFSSTPAPPVPENVWHFKNIDAYNCIDSFAINEYNYNRGQAGTWGVGLFITASEFTRVIIDGCRAWNNADDGINTNPGGQIILKNSWSFSNGVYLSRVSHQTAGNGYKLNAAWNEGYDNPERVLHIVYNNIAAFNNGQGYTENSNGLPYMYRMNYNNLAYKNKQNGFAIQGNRPAEYEHRDNQYINNISLLNTAFDFGEFQGGSAKTEMYNSWNNPPDVSATIDDFVYKDDQIIKMLLKAPRQSDGSLPEIHPFTLAPNSDLKDKGFTGVVDSLAFLGEVFTYSGIAPDIGPYEDRSGDTALVKVTGIDITGVNEGAEIKLETGTLSLKAIISPNNATNKTVTWSIINGDGKATIGYTGLVTAISDGGITVRATANDGSGVYKELNFNIIKPIVLVNTIIVYASEYKTSIDSIGNELQLFANTLPNNASNKSVLWEVEDITGSATINQNGVLKSVSKGIVNVKAIAKDGSGTHGKLTITINDFDDQLLYINVLPEQIKVSIENNTDNCYILSIYRVNGSLIKELRTIDKEFFIERSIFSPGLYIFALKDKDNIIDTSKVIITQK